MVQQLTMMEQCIVRLRTDGIFIPPTPRKNHLLLREDPQKQP